MDKNCYCRTWICWSASAHAFSSKYEVIGFDINQTRVDELKGGFDKTLELSQEQMREAIDNRNGVYHIFK